MTWDYRRNPYLLCHFNSHPHKEDDAARRSPFIRPIIISTHILTRRMTQYKFQILCSFFISTHILTRRMTIPPVPIFRKENISTHILTRRMTASLIFSLYQHAYFNSHPHEEDDCISNSYRLNYRISTHILTRRMTGTLDEDGERDDYFNSHPHEEDDLK